MRDLAFERIKYTSKEVTNQYTKQGKYALVELLDEKSCPDCKIKNSMLFADVIMINNNKALLEDYSKHLSLNTKVVQTTNLEAIR